MAKKPMPLKKTTKKPAPVPSKANVKANLKNILLTMAMKYGGEILMPHIEKALEDLKSKATVLIDKLNEPMEKTIKEIKSLGYSESVAKVIALWEFGIIEHDEFINLVSQIEKETTNFRTTKSTNSMPFTKITIQAQIEILKEVLKTLEGIVQNLENASTSYKREIEKIDGNILGEILQKSILPNYDVTNTSVKKILDKISSKDIANVRRVITALETLMNSLPV